MQGPVVRGGLATHMATRTAAEGSLSSSTRKQLHMLNLPRLIVYSFLQTGSIVNKISRLSKQERKLLGDAAIVFHGR